MTNRKTVVVRLGLASVIGTLVLAWCKVAPLSDSECRTLWALLSIVIIVLGGHDARALLRRGLDVALRALDRYVPTEASAAGFAAACAAVAAGLWVLGPASVLRVSCEGYAIVHTTGPIGGQHECEEPTPVLSWHPTQSMSDARTNTRCFADVDGRRELVKCEFVE